MFNVYLAQGRDPAERMISAADASEPWTLIVSGARPLVGRSIRG